MVRPELPLARFPPDCKPHHAVGHAVLQGSSPPCLSETRKTSAPMKQSPRLCVFVGCNRRVMRCHEHQWTSLPDLPALMFLKSQKTTNEASPPSCPDFRTAAAAQEPTRRTAQHTASAGLWAGPHPSAVHIERSYLSTMKRKWTSLSAENQKYSGFVWKWCNSRFHSSSLFFLTHLWGGLQTHSRPNPMNSQLHPPRSAAAESKAVSSGDVMVKLCLIDPGFYWCAV